MNVYDLIGPISNIVIGIMLYIVAKTGVFVKEDYKVGWEGSAKQNVLKWCGCILAFLGLVRLILLFVG